MGISEGGEGETVVVRERGGGDKQGAGLEEGRGPGEGEGEKIGGGR